MAQFQPTHDQGIQADPAAIGRDLRGAVSPRPAYLYLIGTELPIGCQNQQLLDLSLGNEESVEGIPVMCGKGRDMKGMAMLDR